jgi:hypothetical protein
MGEATSGSPPGGEAPNRRGWRPPDDASASGLSGSPGPERYELRPPEAPPPPPHQPAAPPTTLPGSVAGLARAVNTTSVQSGGNGVSTTVVTFRLEQYDARAGRTGVVTVRLFGDDALGFVSEGDWVEVVGKSKRGFIQAAKAVNHTSQAQYSRSGQGVVKVVQYIVFSLVVLFILTIFVSILVSIVRS